LQQAKRRSIFRRIDGRAAQGGIGRFLPHRHRHLSVLFWFVFSMQ
jgi:hypothetical protein